MQNAKCKMQNCGRGKNCQRLHFPSRKGNELKLKAPSIIKCKYYILLCRRTVIRFNTKLHRIFSEQSDPKFCILHSAFCIFRYCPKNGRHEYFMSAEWLQLLTDTESCDDCTISFDVVLLKVCEKVSSLTNHHVKAAT